MDDKGKKVLRRFWASRYEGGHTTPQNTSKKMAPIPLPTPSLALSTQRALCMQKIKNQMWLVKGHTELLGNLVKDLDDLYAKEVEEAITAYKESLEKR